MEAEQVTEPIQETPAVAESQPVAETSEVKPEVKAEEKAPDEESSVIKEMRRALKRQQRENADLRRMVETAIPKEQPPTREQYQNDESFVDARFAYNQRVAQTPSPVDAVLSEKVAEATKQHADFTEKMGDIEHVMFHRPTLAAALEPFQYASEVLYHLASNPEVAEEVARLSPIAMSARLGEIHSDIRREKKTTKPVSKAPAPITPASSSATPIKGYDDMSPEEFHRVRMVERRKARMGVGA